MTFRKDLCNGFRAAVCSVTTIFVASVLLPSFLLASDVHAAVSQLPAPDQILVQSEAVATPVLRGLRLDPTNPLNIDFVVDTGDKKAINQEEAARLIRYFIAGLTVAEGDVWVNLSPYEEDRVTSDSLLNAELGDELLEQDYILKQLSSSVTYPESETGKEFWASAREKMAQQGIVGDLPMDTFNKIWIAPNTAEIYENGTTALINEASLKAMLEQDYLAAKNNSETANGDQVTKITASLMREIVVPEVEKAVNQSEEFSKLRQIYHSLVLASWFKQRFNDSFFSLYIDSGNTKGVNSKDAGLKDQIFGLYVDAFKKGVYNYVKKEYDATVNRKVKRAYFSGGVTVESSAVMEFTQDADYSRSKFDDANLQIIDSDAILTEEDALSVATQSSNVKIDFDINRNPPKLSIDSMHNTIMPNVEASFNFMKEMMQSEGLYTDEVAEHEKVIRERVEGALNRIATRLRDVKNKINTNATASEGGKFAYFASAANPLQWAHIIFMLEAIADHGVDKVIMVPQGIDERKPDLIDPTIRHPYNEHMLNTLFPGLIEYSDIALDNKDDGETNVYKMMRKYPNQDFDVSYMVGTDHNNIFVTSSRPDAFKIDTIGKFMEKGRKHNKLVADHPERAKKQQAQPFMMKRFGEHYQEIVQKDGDFDGTDIKFLEPFPIVVSATRIRNGFQGSDLPALVFLPVADANYYNLLKNVYSEAAEAAAAKKTDAKEVVTSIKSSEAIADFNDLVRQFRSGELFKTPILDQVGNETKETKPLSVRFDGVEQVVKDFFTIDIDGTMSPDLIISTLVAEHKKIMDQKEPISFKQKLDAELIEGIFSAYAYNKLDALVEQGQRNIKLELSEYLPALSIDQTKTVAKKFASQWNAKNENDPISISVSTTSSAVTSIDLKREYNDAYNYTEEVYLKVKGKDVKTTKHPARGMMTNFIYEASRALETLEARYIGDDLTKFYTQETALPLIAAVFEDNAEFFTELALQDHYQVSVSGQLNKPGYANAYNTARKILIDNLRTQAYESYTNEAAIELLSKNGMKAETAQMTVIFLDHYLHAKKGEGTAKSDLQTMIDNHVFEVDMARGTPTLVLNEEYSAKQSSAVLWETVDEKKLNDFLAQAITMSEEDKVFKNRVHVRMDAMMKIKDADFRRMTIDAVKYLALKRGLGVNSVNIRWEYGTVNDIMWALGQRVDYDGLSYTDAQKADVANFIKSNDIDVTVPSHAAVMPNLAKFAQALKVKDSKSISDVIAENSSLLNEEILAEGRRRNYNNPANATASDLVNPKSFDQDLVAMRLEKYDLAQQKQSSAVLWETVDEAKLNAYLAQPLSMSNEDKVYLSKVRVRMDSLMQIENAEWRNMLIDAVRYLALKRGVGTNGANMRYEFGTANDIMWALGQRADYDEVTYTDVQKADMANFIQANDIQVTVPSHASVMKDLKKFADAISNRGNKSVSEVIAGNDAALQEEILAEGRRRQYRNPANATISDVANRQAFDKDLVSSRLATLGMAQEKNVTSPATTGGIDMKFASSSISTAEGSVKIVLPKVDLQGAKGLTFKVVSIDSIDSIDEFMTYAWAK